MDYYTKRKIKLWFKLRWKWLTGSAVFLSIGLVTFLVGMHVTGWSLIKWLQTGFATTTFICIGGGLFLFIISCLAIKNAENLNG